MTNNRIRVLLLVAAAGSFAAECPPPDQSRPGEPWCSSGLSVLSVDDSEVPDEIKDALYASGWTLGTDDPNYSDNPKLIIIPYTLGDLPENEYVTPELIRETFFTTGVGSVNDYYQENSWGQFRLSEGAIADWVNLEGTPESYGEGLPGGDWSRNPALARDIMQASNVPWEQFDLNGDRRIDYPEAAILFLGPWGRLGANRPSEVQFSYMGQTWTVNNSFVYFDSKRGDDPTAGVDTLSYNLPVIIHELNHGLFGLPDRYDGYSGQGATGWYDPQCENFHVKHLTIYDKMKIGWIQPRILSVLPDRPEEERRCLSFPNIETAPAALALVDPYHPDQYWLVENRYIDASPRGFEDGLPESGLAIWWAKDDGTLRLVDASQPDQNPTLYRDQFVGALFKQDTGSELDPATVPRLLMRDEGLFSFAIRGVSPEGPTMYAEF